jgi:hypothetical protein
LFKGFTYLGWDWFAGISALEYAGHGGAILNPLHELKKPTKTSTIKVNNNFFFIMKHLKVNRKI